MNFQSPQTKDVQEFDLGSMILNALLERPQDCAFQFEGAKLSRGALRQSAMTLAARLRKAGVQPGVAVAIEVEHSLDLPIAMCGVQIAGGCAVPVDPLASAARRQAILSDIRPAIVLSRDADAVETICITPSETPNVPQTEDADLAFVVYTSGSSGGPKGVMITRESYVQRMQQVLPSFTPRPDDIDLAWTPSSFTVMIDEMFLPILAGMPSVIVRPSLQSDPRAFAELVRAKAVTSFRLTPSVLDLLLRSGGAEALAGVRTIVCSGEALPADLQVRCHKLLPATLLGFYGATEAPAVAYIPYDRNGPPQDTTVCVPQPFARMCVMQSNETPADVGEAGEVWVGGLALAKGYYLRPELTAEKFVMREGARWYRTGDLGRQIGNGTFEILGRTDMTEVNINGARVSLPELNEALRAQPNVDAAWVSPVIRDGRPDPILVAHCVVRQGHDFDGAALRRDLATSLPSTSVPAVVTQIAVMPLTDNGKIDARLLSDMALAKLGATTAIGGHCDEEEGARDDDMLACVLASAKQCLSASGLVAQDNFFAVGGDSLKAVHFALDLSDRLSCEVKASLIANADTFADLALRLSSGEFQSGFAARLIKGGGPNAVPVFTINDRRRYEILSPQLSADCRIWNLDIYGLADGTLPDLQTFDLADLAEAFADQVMAADPQGPWHLMAFCKSACLAIETARVLQARTGCTCGLILIDAFFTEFLPTPRVHVLRLFDFGPGYYARKIMNRFGLASWDARAEDVPIEVHAAALQMTGDQGALRARFNRLCVIYQIEPYDGPVTLVASKEFRHNSRASSTKLAARGLAVEIVDGLHLTLFQPKPNGLALSDVLDGIVRKGLDNLDVAKVP